MKTNKLFLILILLSQFATGQINDNGSVDGPMTTAEILAFPNPLLGQTIYSSDTNTDWQFNGTTWIDTGSGGGTAPRDAGVGLTLNGNALDVDNPLTPAIQSAIDLNTAKSGVAATERTNWNFAFGWGNHSSAGYLPKSGGLANAMTGDLHFTGNFIAGISRLNFDTITTDVVGVRNIGYRSDTDKFVFRDENNIVGNFASEAFVLANAGGTAPRDAGVGLTLNGNAFDVDNPFTATDESNLNTAFGWGDWSTGVDQTFVEGLGFQTNASGFSIPAFGGSGNRGLGVDDNGDFYRIPGPSTDELNTGTEIDIRSFSPAAIKSMIDTHSGTADPSARIRPGLDAYKFGDTSFETDKGYADLMVIDTLELKSGPATPAAITNLAGIPFYNTSTEELLITDSSGNFQSVSGSGAAEYRNPNLIFDDRADAEAVTNTWFEATGLEDDQLWNENILGEERTYSIGAGFTSTKKAIVKPSNIDAVMNFEVDSGFEIIGNGLELVDTANGLGNGFYVDSLNVASFYKRGTTIYVDGAFKRYTAAPLGPPELMTISSATSDPNGNETDATTGWNTNISTLESVETDTDLGSHVLAVTSTGDSGNSGTNQVLSGLDPSKTYVFRFRAKGVSGSRVQLLGAELDGSQILYTIPTGYSDNTIVFDPLGTSITLHFRIDLISATSNGETIYISQTSLKEQE